MKNADVLIGNEKNDNSKYCLTKPGELYLVYLPKGGTTELDLAGVNGDFTVKWFNPRRGGPFLSGSIGRVKGSGKVSVGQPPSDPGQDWVAIVRVQ